LELSPSDWGFVARTVVPMGIKYYKITGGEPLVRPDAPEIVREIREAGGIVSMVTNGSLLDKYAERLVISGLEHLNVSLHSLDPDKFYRITRGRLENVLKGIEEALQYGLKIKIDYVVLTWNKDEYLNIINYAEKHGLDLNIIELIPLGMKPDDWRKLHVGLEDIIDYLERHSIEKKIKDFQSRPIYMLNSGIEVTVIRGICNPELCMRCTRLRMTPSGGIKTCIYREDDIIDAYRYIIERDSQGLINAFKKAVEIREPYFKPGETPEKLKPYLILLDETVS